MTKEEKIRFRGEMETRTLKFAADVAALLKRFGGDENRNTRLQLAKSSTSIGANYREANRAETVSDFLHKIGFVPPHAVTTIYYIVRKRGGKALADKAIDWLLALFKVADCGTDEFKAARASSIDDYEDAVVVASAQKTGCDYIVTRNAAHFKNSPIQVLLPTDFVAKSGFVVARVRLARSDRRTRAMTKANSPHEADIARQIAEGRIRSPDWKGNRCA